MRTGRILGVVGAAMLGAFVLQSQAQAQVPLVGKATSYRVQFVRAMDECTGPGVTLVKPGNVAGCLQANSTTDSGVTGMLRANLAVIPNNKLGGLIRFSGNGITPTGTNVGVQITFRSTNSLTIPAATSKTYEDITVICGDTPGGMCGNSTTVKSNGRVQLRQSLNDCMTANGLNSAILVGPGSQIEIRDAALVNCATGKVFGQPGVKLK